MTHNSSFFCPNNMILSFYAIHVLSIVIIVIINNSKSNDILYFDKIVLLDIPSTRLAVCKKYHLNVSRLKCAHVCSVPISTGVIYQIFIMIS